MLYVKAVQVHCLATPRLLLLYLRPTSQNLYPISISSKVHVRSLRLI